jgi:hypothetical protein
MPIVQVPSGRLEVKRIGKPTVAPCTRERPCDAVATTALRVRVVAEAIPLGTLAAALSSELGIGVVTDASLVGVRVSVALPDASLGDLASVLRSEYRVWARFVDAGLTFTTPRREMERRRAEVSLTPLETRIVPLPASLSPAQVAATWCAASAGPHGAASVVGQALVVVDWVGPLTRLDELVKALSAPPKP